VAANRSFDHYFGTKSRVRGFADPTRYQSYAGGPRTRPPGVFSQSTVYQGSPLLMVGGDQYLSPFELVNNPPNANGQTLDDITHDWGPQHLAWNDGAMDQFVVQHLLNDGTAKLQYGTGPGGLPVPGTSTRPSASRPWATTGPAIRWSSTGPWRRRSRSATATTARSSGRPTRTACCGYPGAWTPTRAMSAGRCSRPGPQGLHVSPWRYDLVGDLSNALPTLTAPVVSPPALPPASMGDPTVVEQNVLLGFAGTADYGPAYPVPTSNGPIPAQDDPGPTRVAKAGAVTPARS
jgi:hypothetical protein